MTVILINPNSTAAMTEAMLAQAQGAAPELGFEGWTSTQGPPAIQGRADGAAATGPLLALAGSAQGAQGLIIGCFDDTALAEAAQRAPCPVIGIGQASYAYAALRQWRFSVVTALAVSVPILEENIQHAGLGAHLGRVRASGVPVLALERDPGAAAHAIVAEAQAAAQDDEIDAVILGCAGMVTVHAALTQALDLPVIDPVSCAAKAMRWLI